MLVIKRQKQCPADQRVLHTYLLCYPGEKCIKCATSHDIQPLPQSTPLSKRKIISIIQQSLQKKQHLTKVTSLGKRICPRDSSIFVEMLAMSHRTRTALHLFNTTSENDLFTF